MIDEKKLIEDFRKCYCGHIGMEESDTMIAFKSICRIINNQPKIGGWIPCSERMPEEHNSIFAKLKGTDKWSNAMFEKISDDVNVTVEFEDGQRKTMTLHTIDGRWDGGYRGVKFKVVAWQPLPEPYIANENDEMGGAGE